MELVLLSPLILMPTGAINQLWVWLRTWQELSSMLSLLWGNQTRHVWLRSQVSIPLSCPAVVNKSGSLTLLTRLFPMIWKRELRLWSQDMSLYLEHQGHIGDPIKFVFLSFFFFTKYFLGFLFKWIEDLQSTLQRSLKGQCVPSIHVYPCSN